MIISIRCLLIFIAICALCEVVILVGMVNGYFTELEPFLHLLFDEEQMDTLKAFRDMDANGMLMNDEDAGAEQQQQEILAASGKSSVGSGFTENNNNNDNNDNVQQQEVVDAPISFAARKALNDKFTTAVLSLNYDEARDMLRFTSGVDVNWVGDSKGHLLFRLCGGKKETTQMLKMVELLLAQKDVDPNDDSTSWPPLKGAIHARNLQCAVKLLRHKDIVPMIHTSGLHCDSVPHILPEITLITSPDTPECFLKHPNVATMDDEKVIQGSTKKNKRRTEIKLAKSLNEQLRNDKNKKGSSGGNTKKTSGSQKMKYKSDFASSSSASASFSNNNNKQQQQQKTAPKKKTAIKWEVVLDPSHFDSLFEASWFYIFGKQWDDCSDKVKVLIVFVGAHTLFVGGACYFYLSTLIADERAGIVPEVMTPPMTPAMGPQQPVGAAADAAENNNNEEPPVPAAATLVVKEEETEVKSTEEKEEVTENKQEKVEDEKQKEEAVVEEKKTDGELTADDFEPK